MDKVTKYMYADTYVHVYIHTILHSFLYLSMYIESHKFIQYVQFNLMTHGTFHIFSFHISNIHLKSEIPIILNPFSYLLNPPVCNQCTDPAGPPPYLANPNEFIFNWTQSVKILKV